MTTRIFKAIALVVAISVAIPTYSYFTSDQADFFSYQGREHLVSYQATYRANHGNLDFIKNMNEEERAHFIENELGPLQGFLFGPAVRRDIGSPQKLYKIEVNWDSARIVDGIVEIDYSSVAPWILDVQVAMQKQFEFPVPYNQETVFTSHWKKCSDHDPGHQTRDFFWYFWDPQRPGCDHIEGRQFQNTVFTIGLETTNETKTYPEYDKILKSAGKENNLQMTFAFGYVNTPTSPNPERDNDYGIRQYRSFIRYVRKEYSYLKESKILLREYKDFQGDNTVIGRRFTGSKDGVKIKLNIVVAGNVDQMEVFAKSFAHDHDGFFAWFGHSRLGAGFDADLLSWKLFTEPGYYSVSNQYQLIYWAGCNSYSYYTLPFFKFKAKANPQDYNGTKGLDIIANGLPSLFALNDVNARITLYALMNWSHRYSYQDIVTTLEKQVERLGRKALVLVMGDEDNE